MHPWSRLFFDERTQQYTVSRWLDDLRQRFGGPDSVLIWPTYPVLGLDDRTQYDLIAAMPGGLAGVASIVTELQADGVHVLWPYLPWDNGTALDPLGRTDAQRATALVIKTGASGLNGDSMIGFPQAFFAVSVAAGQPIALQAEDGPNPADPHSLNWQTFDIGYWGGSVGRYTGGGGGDWPFAPAVDKWKWLDTRRVTVVSDRWAKNKTDNLQARWQRCLYSPHCVLLLPPPPLLLPSWRPLAPPSSSPPSSSLILAAKAPSATFPQAAFYNDDAFDCVTD